MATSYLVIQVQASPVTIAYNHETAATGSHIHTAHPSSTTNPSMQGESFNVTTSGYITGLAARMSKANNPTGYLTAEIWNNDSGTYGTNMVPTGAPIATSTSIDIATIGAVTATYTFSFSGSGTEYLEIGHTYVFTIKAETDSVLNGTEFIGIENTVAWEGNSVTYHDSAYYIETGDLWFTITGNTEAPGATPAATSSGIIIDNTLYEAIIDFLTPVFIMLVPSFLLWYLGGKGKWPLLIGLAIGTGLGFVFGLVPIWLVFLVAVGLIGMAYSDVSSGGSYT